jgi:magnesium-transporting ATPase (P-type)
MTSFATRVQLPPPLTPTEIAFYATCATVVPVLFLAFAVQGRTWRTMLSVAVSSAKIKRELGHRPWGAWRLIFFGYLVLLAGLVGEGYSIGGLYYDRQDTQRTITVLVAVIFLNFTVVSIPMNLFTSALWAVWRSKTQAQATSEQDSEPEPQHLELKPCAEGTRSDRDVVVISATAVVAAALATLGSGIAVVVALRGAGRRPNDRSFLE